MIMIVPAMFGRLAARRLMQVAGRTMFRQAGVLLRHQSSAIPGFAARLMADDVRKRLFRGLRVETRMNWFGDEVARNIRIGMRARLKLAAQLLRDRTVVNLSTPVRKFKGASGRIRVDPTSRSKPGEFPRADTTRLMKDVFWQMRGEMTAIVGTSLDYGAILETTMDRSFLVRTLNENLRMITGVLASSRRFPGEV